MMTVIMISHCCVALQKIKQWQTNIFLFLPHILRTDRSFKYCIAATNLLRAFWDVIPSECQPQLYCIFLYDFTLSGTSEHKLNRVKCGMLRPKWPLAPAGQSSHPKQVLVRPADTGLPFLILPGILRSVCLESSWPAADQPQRRH